ncbi:hypothetical protein BLNAU_17237 [Blattamonas nauphoetae]|uniref:Uncharacterized protein n=1 Tax=Blattamonas nauphoetae TaxID=2049346 RepID=A0ABQ9XB00_9EUKA|nr:hypothetical protein BLNAU_17237 [Blattamonas nauphoetae]
MESILNSDKHHAAAHEATPLFLRTDPNDINTLDQLTTLLLSLICHLDGENAFTEIVSTRACVLLKRIVPLCREMDADPDIHFKHIHSPQSSFNRLTESIVSLLRCSNEDLVQITISCLCDILRRVSPSTLFDFIAAGLFSLLPHAFYQQDMHLVPHADSNLMVILYWFVFCSHHDNSRMICEKDEISTEAFQQIYMDKFIHPVEPFIEFICQNSRRIANSDDESDFPRLLGTLVGHSPFLAQMTLSILSLSVPFAFTASLAVFESDDKTSALLHPLLDGLLEWQAEGPAVHLRSKQILAKLREGGLSDELELYFRRMGSRKRVDSSAMLRAVGPQERILSGLSTDSAKADSNEKSATSHHDRTRIVNSILRQTRPNGSLAPISTGNHVEIVVALSHHPESLQQGTMTSIVGPLLPTPQSPPFLF